jgi:hypothetical protein
MMAEAATQYAYNIKIERSAKGARWAVHCYSNDRETALKESVALYDRVGKDLEAQGLTVAPVERSGKE